MKAAIQMNRALSQEELLQVSGGFAEEDNLSFNDILDRLLKPLKSIVKSIIGPILPDTFEEFYALVKASMSIIEKKISDYDWKVRLAFKAYNALPESAKRDIWKAVYNALKVEMPMA